MAGKKPDYDLCVKPKTGEGYNAKVGVAWRDEEGRISIKLNTCAVLSHADDVWISLYPAKNKEPRRVKPEPALDYGPPPMSDDNLPF